MDRIRWAVVEMLPGRFRALPFSGDMPAGALEVVSREAEARTACRLLESTYRIDREREGRKGPPDAKEGELFG